MEKSNHSFISKQDEEEEEIKYENNNIANITEKKSNLKSFKESVIPIKKEEESKIKIILTRSLQIEESILHFSYSRLFFAYNESKNFEYTNLDGITCIIINRIMSSLLLNIYDMFDFKKQFEIELYTNIELGYTCLTSTFHCIEYPTFFVGLQFPNQKLADGFKNCVIIHSKILNAESNQFSYETPNILKNNIQIEKILKAKKSLKIDKVEKLITFNYVYETDDLEFNVTKAANKFLESNGLTTAELNHEYEVLKDRMKEMPEIEGEVNGEGEEEENEERNDNSENKEENLRNEEKEREREKKEKERIEKVMKTFIEQEKEKEEEQFAYLKNINKVKRKNNDFRNETGIKKVTNLPSGKYNDDEGYSNDSEDDINVFSKIEKKDRKRAKSKKSFNKLPSFFRKNTVQK